MSVKPKWIEKINYKDIIIIYSLWFFSLFINRYFSFASFVTVPNLSGFFDLLSLFVTRLIFSGLIFTYFNLLYDLSINDLGITLKSFFKKIIKIIAYLTVLFGFVIILINLPLSTSNISNIFKPVYQITDLNTFVRSLFPFFTLYPIVMIIVFAEQLMLNLFVYEIFNYKLPTVIAKLFSSIFFSFILLSFETEKILILFIIALISINLYERTDKSLLFPTFFGTGFYLIYILYIYGWNFI